MFNEGTQLSIAGFSGTLRMNIKLINLLIYKLSAWCLK